ncbi:MAG: aminomethyl-transferring glycine dehydrogenase subunit GcvPA [Thermoplasmata archaeon]|nr:MAG: aminomethyl-transferring glycine dehydrogenase subunit GcvPA [Thermoplasmata archaeon]
MDEIEEMLRYIGVKSVDELFEDIPRSIRRDLAIAEGTDEREVVRDLERILSKNLCARDYAFFLGGGVYFNFVPAIVKAITELPQFYTAYTPYQPEASQGILQAVFEYQSLMAELLEMDVVNASMYDGGSAAAEAMLMARRIRWAGGDRKGQDMDSIAVAKNINPYRRRVLETYAGVARINLIYVDFDKKTGKIDMAGLDEKMSDDVFAFYMENPNFFGVVEDEVVRVRDVIGDRIFIVGVNPYSLGVIIPPGRYDADIVVGDAQPLGLSMNMGGPSLGVFACKAKYVRRMPGRLIGMTADADGRRAFCMTLQTREQHIRRGRATSNICTNNTLCAIAVAVYLALIGGVGLRRLGIETMKKARKLCRVINEFEHCLSPIFDGKFFNEFVAKIDGIKERYHDFVRNGVFPGIPIGDSFEGMNPNAILVSVGDAVTDEDIEKYRRALEVMASD